MMRLLLRLFRLLLTVWGLLTVLFLLTHLLPGEQQVLARFAEAPTAIESPTEAQWRAAQQAERQRLGLDKPMFYFSAAHPTASTPLLRSRWRWNGPHNQYHAWLRQLLHGNLGRSYRSDEPVTDLLTEAVRYTLPVSGLAFVLIVGLSVLLGLWLARRPPTHWTFTALTALNTLPLFVVALLLLLLLANPDLLSLFPAYGLNVADSSAGLPGLLQQPWYLVLPVASLVLASLTEPAIQLAATLRHEAGLDYFRTARAKGLPTSQALRRHALRNSLLPLLTIFTELAPNLLSGSIVVELVFALPGLGRLLAESAAARDYPVLLGGVLVILLVRLLFLLLADWLYHLVDPRLQLPVS